MPPSDASTTRTPSSTAAATEAIPVLRVLWKCTRSRWPVPCCSTTSRTRSTRVRTSVGTATPIVSASAISTPPAAAHCCATDSRRPSGISPSYGHPNTVVSVTLAGMPASAAAAATSVQTASAPSVSVPWFLRLNVSLTGTTAFTSSHRAAAARSNPRRLSTRPMNDVAAIAEPGPAALRRRCSSSMTASESAICGTFAGLTKLAVSIRRRPAATASSMSVSFAPVGTTAPSLWSPSRGATSTMVTCSAICAS